MTKFTKKFCREWDYFIKPGKHRKIVFNKKCDKCMNECKQSYNAEIIFCPDFKKVDTIKGGK